MAAGSSSRTACRTEIGSARSVAALRRRGSAPNQCAGPAPAPCATAMAGEWPARPGFRLRQWHPMLCPAASLPGFWLRRLRRLRIAPLAVCSVGRWGQRATSKTAGGLISAASAIGQTACAARPSSHCRGGARGRLQRWGAVGPSPPMFAIRPPPAVTRQGASPCHGGRQGIWWNIEPLPYNAWASPR